MHRNRRAGGPPRGDREVVLEYVTYALMRAASAIVPTLGSLGNSSVRQDASETKTLTSQRSDMSTLTMSPTILAFPANEFAGDFQGLRFGWTKHGDRTAAPGDGDGSATLLDLVQQRQALGLELRRTHAMILLDGNLCQRAIQRA